MALTDIAIRNAKPGAKAIKLADGGGMFLLVNPTGGKLWRLKYRIDGREKLLAIGSYPEVGLGELTERSKGIAAYLENRWTATPMGFAKRSGISRMGTGRKPLAGASSRSRGLARDPSGRTCFY